MSDETKDLTPTDVADQTMREMARLQGWVPKEEYRGDPENWRDYKEFLDVGQRIQPVLRERNKALTDRLSSLENTVAAFSKHYEKVHESAYNKAMADLKAQQAAAVKAGDSEQYEKLEQQRDELEKNKPQPSAGQKKPTSPGFKEFQVENPWYGTDAPMSMYADSIGKYIHSMNPDLVGEEFYNKVVKEVKERFPDKFGTKPPGVNPPVTPVEGGGHPPAPPGLTGQKTYDNLPPEAKAECDRFVREKLLTKEQYVADYEW